MPKYLDISQNTDEWTTARLGLPTASQADKIITPLGKPSAQWKVYANKCIAEKILKRPVDFSIADSKWMERGHELEKDAINYYEAQTSIDTMPGGFVISDNGTCGCSPDRLAGYEGLLETKCPAPHTQIGYLLSQMPGNEDKGIEDKYTPQLQMQLFVTGRKWVDILSYDPDFPDHVIMRVTRNDAYIKCLEALLEKFNDYVADGIIYLADRWKGINYKPDSIDLLLSDNDAKIRIGV